MRSDAHRRADKKYAEAHKEDFKGIYLKLNRKEDADILRRLDEEDNVQGYIKGLIRDDMLRSGK